MRLSTSTKSSFVKGIASLLILVFITHSNIAQQIIPNNEPEDLEFPLNLEQIKLELLAAPMELTEAAKSMPLVFTIPWQGGVKVLEVWESPIMDKAFQNERPDIKTYAFKGYNDTNLTGRFTVSDYGFSGVFLSKGSIVSINPVDLHNPIQHKISKGIDNNGPSVCEVEDDNPAFHGPGHQLEENLEKGAFSNGATLRTYNLAICTTGEFHDANGATVAAATTVVTNSVNGIQAFFEKDIAVRFNLLTPVVYTNYNTDPYTTGLSRTNLSAQVVNMNFTSGQYDIGHTFHDQDQAPAIFSGGGVAYLGAVCSNNPIGTGGFIKGGGWSGSFNNTTNSWYQLAGHEFGHMFDATHTFNGTGGSCTSNISSSTAYEIASGTTIMSYQGICQTNNNIPASGTSDNYFHANSLDRMVSFITTSATCSANTTPGNTPPTANANPTGGTYTIPISTPFTLTASSTDPEGDAVTYCWEQYDEDGGGNPTQGLFGAAAGSNAAAPLFRSFPPTTNPSRNFPELSVILNENNVTDFEPLPSVARTLNFRVSVRDNNVTNGNGGLACDDLAITVHDSGTPFQVTSQNTTTSWVANGTNTATITWDVSGTTAAPISCADVDILFSTDGGQTFPFVLASATTNDGTESITVPSLPTCQGRIKVACSTSIFFDINNEHIEISSSCNANGSNISPTAAVSAAAGDPSLNLTLSSNYGTVATTFSTVVDGSDPQMLLTYSNGGSCAAPFSNAPNYEMYEFYVSESDDYTFTNNGSAFPYVFNLYENSFDSNATCSNWLNSTATCCVTIGPSMTSTLCPETKYILVMSTFSTGDPGGTFTCDFSSAGTGSVLSGGGSDPGAGFSYTYAIVNNGTGNIVAFDVNADLSNAATYPSGTSYSVYGLSYETIANLAPYAGGSFSTFQTDLFNLTICGHLSSNNVAVTITGAATCNISNSGLTNVSCNDNGTPSWPIDDYITFDLNPAGTTLGTNYTVSGATLITNMGAYGATTSFQTEPGTAGEGDLSLTITDDVDGACKLSFTVTDPGTCSTTCDLVINEIDYDQPGTDDGEFIEIYNPCTSAINLDNYSIEFLNGTNGSTYQNFDLPNVSLAAGGYFVLCGDGGNTANCDLDVTPNTNLIQNGAPDAVGLKNNGNIVDGISYEGDNANTALFTATTGTSGGDNNNDPQIGFSRFPDGNDTHNNDTDFSLRCTTPGAANISPSTNCNACAIISVTAGTQSSCDPATNTYAQDIIVTYSNPPATGDLSVNGQTFAITNSPQTVTITGLEADAGSVDVTTVFTDDSGMTDDFQGATTQGWIVGAPSPNPPIVVTNAGPNGAGDNSLEISSIGGGVPGGRLVVFNQSQWATDWTANNITAVNLDLNNTGLSTINARIAIDGPGGRFATSNSINLSPGSGWGSYVLPVEASNFTFISGANNIAATLSGVTVVRILHAPSPVWISPPSVATLRIDNISAGGCRKVEFGLFNAPAACPCNINDPGISGVMCNDNGTPSDDTDDYITFFLDPQGSNLGTTYSVSGTNLTPASGNYGTGTSFQSDPGTAGSGNISLTITDNSVGTCQFTFNLIDPGSCSTTCQLTNAGLSNIQCNDNNTPSDDTDDYITFDLNPTGNNLGTTYTVSGTNLSPSSGNYIGTTTFQSDPGTAGAGDITLTITDGSDGACTIIVTLTDPGTCSTTCQLTNAGLTNIQCNNNGTPSDDSDDYITFDLNPSGNNLGSTYTVSGTNLSPIGGNYGGTTSFQTDPSTAGAGDISLTITDGTISACTISVTLTDPGTCSTTCNLTNAGLSNIQCNDNGTPSDDTDDYITFDLAPTGVNIGTTYTVSGTNLTPSTGNYGATTSFQTDPGTAGSGDISLTITDGTAGTCTITLTLTDPGTCSTTCNLSSAGLSNILCNDNGTPSDDTDDYITFDLSPSGSNLGASYSVSGTNLTPSTGNYGATTSFQTDPASAGTGNITLTITDATDGSCVIFVTLTDPGTCSNSCNISTAGLSNVQCNNNGTDSDPSDDYITFVLNPSGVNLGASYTVNGINLTPNSGNYGGITAFQTDPGTAGAGNLSLTITDNSNSSCTFSLNITDPGTCSTSCASPTLSETHVDVSCPGGSDGSIDLTVSGGTPGYTFDWDNDGTGDNDDTEDLSGLPAGTYNVTVTESGGCSSTLSVSISGGTDTTPPTASCKNVTVALGTDGNATISTANIDDGSTDNCGIVNLSLDNSTFNCSNLGSNTVTLTVDDGNGNTASCTGTVTINDNLPPTATCQNPTIQLDASGNASISTSDIDNGSADNCGSVILSVDIFSFDCSNLGSNTVTLTVSDGNGNSSICTSTVTIADGIAPNAICQDLTIQLDASGNAIITTADIDNGSSDNCGIVNLSLDNSTFNCSNIGANTVTLTVTDGSVNPATCTATVTIEDNSNPSANCQNITVSLDATGDANIVAADVDNGSSDGCNNITLSIDNSTFNCSNIGANTVTLTIDDNNGNTASCTSTVTIADDMAPNAVCQDATVSLDASGNASISTADIDNGSSDNCGTANLSLDITAFDCSTVGANVVTLTVNDGNGNTSVCTASVTVEDNEIPTAICQDITVQLDANGNVSIAGAEVNNGSTDNCSLTFSLDNSTFNCTNVGANTVTLTADDGNGNSSTCTATVTIEDNLSPTAICQDITIQLDASGNASITESDVNNGSGDNCSLTTLSLDNSSFTCSNVGGNTVTLSISDNNGNTASCTATVTVEDDIAPTALCQNVTIQVDALGNASITTADIDDGSNDICGIANLSLDITMFTCSELGVNTVTLTATDSNGNDGTCTATVTVADDNNPCCTAAVALCQDFTALLDASGNVNITASDVDGGSTADCGLQSLTVSPNSFDCTNIGGNTVTLTIIDLNGNTDNCNTIVTVADNLPPNALCQDLVVDLDAAGNASIAAVDLDNGSNDACGAVSLSASQTIFTCSNVGVNSINLIVTDIAGNTAFCTSNVSVIASLACTPGSIENSGGPTVADPCTCRGNGEFDEEVVINSVSGIDWAVASTTLLDPANLAAYPAGTLLNEIQQAGGLSNYSLAGVHLDGVGYTLTAISTFYPGQSLTISNTCYYPDPVIITPQAGSYCLNSPSITMEGNAGNVEGSGAFTINGMVTNTFDPAALGLGSHLIVFTWDAGNPTSLLSPADVGCTESTSFFVNIIDTPVDLACNDYAQISVDENCEVLIMPDDILEGSFGCFDDYTISIAQTNGLPVSNPVSGGFIGQDLIVTVSHIPSGNTCWGTVTLEDKIAPVVTCIDAQLTCEDDPSTVPGATATDNCDNNPTVQMTEEVIDNSNQCSDLFPNDGIAGWVTIERTFIAIDNAGNISDECIQTIVQFRPDDIDFPDDITWQCTQYSNYPGIINSDPLNPVIIDTEPSPPDTDNDIDVDPDLSGFILSNTGSGVPGNIDGPTCLYQTTLSDDIIESCGNSFKIIRTWTVLNWCTGDVITSNNAGEDHIQVIKIIDEIAPSISANNFSLNANNPAVHPGVCNSTGLIPAPSVSDNCNDFTISIFTPVGEAIYVNGTDGSEGGFIPGTGLELGIHDITYNAEDDCGNISQLTIQVTILDDQIPGAVCDEITDVNLASDGFAVVEAFSFDDGSVDNCCIGYFEAHRMQDNCNIPGNMVFGPTVTFCCEDIDNSPHMVAFRVYDCDGNFNECMVEVYVSDKLDPSLLSCPPPQTITCDTYYDELEVQLNLGNYSVLQNYGTALFIDNCEVIVTESHTVTIDQCGVGNITRSWTAVDQSDNGPVSCTQTISIEHVSDFEVEFPADITVTCGNSVPDFGEPTIFFETCELIAISHEDVIFNVVSDACYKITRDWVVINWCNIGAAVGDDLPDPQVGPRRFQDGGDGYITYEQIIKVIDDEQPIFPNGCSIDNICILDNTCGATFILPMPEVQDCSDEVTISVSSDVGNGFGNFVNIPPGTYTATFTAMDNCGNSNSCQSTFIVEDCKNPTPYCVNGLVIELMPVPDCSGTVWATDFDAGSFDNCPGDLLLSFSQDVTDVSQDFTLNDLGQQLIELWVTDAAGNQDYCQTFVEIQANNCGDPFDPAIAGNVSTEELDGVKDVEVSINSPAGFFQMNMTDINGDYIFLSVPQGADFTVTPYKDVDPLNGVTTFDMVLITKHILGSQMLNSPYKIIAADANHSGAVTTLDLVLIRKLILFVNPNFPNNTSWRFVDAAYEFPNPLNPWAEAFPEIINLNNLILDDFENDFVGIKIGDVNGSAIANLNQPLEDRNTVGTLYFQTNNIEVKAGEEYIVDFTVPDFNAIGYQFTMNFDQRTIEFIELIPGAAKEENFGFTLIDEGILTASWHQENTIELAKDEIMFSLKFKAKADANLKNLIHINSQYTRAEAYNEDLDFMEIGLLFNNLETERAFELYQNRPNPFGNSTIIGFQLPEASTAILIISDLSGKILFRTEGNYEGGYNEIQVNDEVLNSTGIFNYQIETPEYTAIRKMVLIK